MASENPFHNERRRLATYRNWTPPGINAELLAKEGFYYTRIGDIIRCAYCGLELTNIGNIENVRALHQASERRCGYISRTEVDSVAVNPQKNTTVKEPLVPRYSSFEKRLESYQDWPKGIRQRPEELAKAGLFYTGKSDHVICFFCGGGVKDWEPNDEPFEEHAKWYPECEFVKFHKDKLLGGQKLVSSTKTPANGRLSAKLNGNLNSNTTDKNKVLENGHLENAICKVCLKNSLSVLFLPCRHCVVCEDCAFVLIKCPVCRSPIEERMKIYL